MKCAMHRVFEIYLGKCRHTHEVGKDKHAVAGSESDPLPYHPPENYKHSKPKHAIAGIGTAPPLTCQATPAGWQTNKEGKCNFAGFLFVMSCCVAQALISSRLQCNDCHQFLLLGLLGLRDHVDDLFLRVKLCGPWSILLRNVHGTSSRCVHGLFCNTVLLNSQNVIGFFTRFDASALFVMETWADGFKCNYSDLESCHCSRDIPYKIIRFFLLLCYSFIA